MMRSYMTIGLLIGMGMACFFPVLGLEPQTKLEVEPNTGDVEFDAALGDLSVEAAGNLAEFLTHVSVTYDVPEEELESLITDEGMTPADVYMSAVVADLAETPIEDVVAEYRDSEGRGWGEIAKRLGIKPGSDAFHQLKDGVRADSEAVTRASKQNGKPENPGQGQKPQKAKKK